MIKEIIESYQWIIDDIDEVGSTQDEVLIGVYHSLTKQLKDIKWAKKQYTIEDI